MTKRGAVVVLGALGCFVPSVMAATVDTLLSDDFTSGTISAPYTTTTALGGTVGSSGGALNIGLAGAAGEKAYISARDNMSAEYLLTNTATFHITADVDFSNLVLTPSPNVNSTNRQIEYVGVIRLMPLVYERIVNSIVNVSFGYSDYNNAYILGMSSTIEYLGGGSQTGLISKSTFNAGKLLHFDLTSTITDLTTLQTNGTLSKDWTINTTLNVTRDGTSLASLVLNSAGKAADSNTYYSPLQHDNILALGNFVHSRNDSNIELFGGYNINQYAYTVTYDGTTGQPPSGGGTSGGGGNGSVPEPASLGMLLAGGWLLGRRTDRGRGSR